MVSSVLSLVCLVAIFGFGAPPLTLVVVGLAGATVYMEIKGRVLGRSGRY
jgi:hypothetical protein